MWQESVSKQWCKLYTSMLFKKGNPEDPDNCRPVTLTNSLSKFFAQIILLNMVVEVSQ